MSGRQLLLRVLVLVAVLAGWGVLDSLPRFDTVMHSSGTPDHRRGASPVSGGSGLPGMPVLVDPHNVYAAAGVGMLSAVVQGDRPLVYVPHTDSGDVWVIDPATFAGGGALPGRAAAAARRAGL